MKKVIILLLLCASLGLNAAWINNQPVTEKTPSGKLLHMFASGDEFYSRLHDKDNYTIVQSSTDGYYYYAVNKDNDIVPSVYKVNSINPSEVGIQPGVKISEEKYLQKKHSWFANTRNNVRAPSLGTVSNIAIFIRFHNQAEFTDTRQYFDDLFNSTASPSMNSYYKEVSYNQLTVNTTLYPTIADNNINISYEDTHERDYFRQYNAVTNSNGYQNQRERAEREQKLLKRAVEFVENQIPTDLAIDADNDGNVDNVCFIIRGDNEGWSDLLWAHRWMMYYEDVYIHGKKVWDYTFQPEPQVVLRTLNHEMFHSFGAPDLYRYSDQSRNQVGKWDIMEQGTAHISAYMKWRYGKWIQTIPEISDNGVYTLNPLTSATNNCYKIPSPNSRQEYFVVEFRKKIPNTFENNLRQEGLVIYRVNSRSDGEGNAAGPPDELYAYRANGTINGNGDINSSSFCIEKGRTIFNSETNPNDFLQGSGSGDGFGGISIANIGSSNGDTISFTLAPTNGTVAGTITTNNDSYDKSLIKLEIGHQIFDVAENGTFSFEYFQGEHSLTIKGPGLESKTVSINVVPEQVTELNAQLNFLQQATNLSYSLAGAVVTLNWDFINPLPANFETFEIWLSIAGNQFRRVMQTNENYVTLPFTAPISNLKAYIVAKYSNGFSGASNTVEVDYSTTNTKADVNPIKTELMQNIPNPFNPVTTINYTTQKSGKVNISIYNIIGQKVVTLINKYQNRGKHQITFTGKSKNGYSLPSGVYFYKLKTANSVITKKMLLLK